MQLIAFLKRHSLVVGIVLMFPCTGPIDLAYAGVMPFQVPYPLYIFLGWGFIFAALIMTGLTLSRATTASLLKRFLIWRVGWQCYLVAFLTLPTLFLSAILLHAAATGATQGYWCSSWRSRSWPRLWSSYVLVLKVCRGASPPRRRAKRSSRS